MSGFVRTWPWQSRARWRARPAPPADYCHHCGGDWEDTDERGRLEHPGGKEWTCRLRYDHCADCSAGRVNHLDR